MDNLLLIHADHPALSGHFPGNPIVPGVIIMEHVIQCAQLHGHTVHGLLSAKFLAPLYPEAQCTVELLTSGRGLNFKVLQEKNIIASGILGISSSESSGQNTTDNGK